MQIKRDTLALVAATYVGAKSQSVFKGVVAGLAVEKVMEYFGVPPELPAQLEPATQTLASLFVNWAREQRS